MEEVLISYFIPFFDLTKEQKEQLIERTYQRYYEIFEESDQEILLNEKVLDILLASSHQFTNARNINHGVKIFMSKVILNNTLGIE